MRAFRMPPLTFERAVERSNAGSSFRRPPYLTPRLSVGRFRPPVLHDRRELARAFSPAWES